jgi:4-carboxymuconolactone decarboxylase
MTRVPSHTTSKGLSGDALDAFDAITASRGKVVGVYSVLLASPPATKMIGELGAFMRFDSVLPAKVREITICTALSEYDAQFEWGPHTKFANDAGVSKMAVDAIRDRTALTGIEADETAIITYVRELIRNHRISDATYQAVADLLDTREITELTALIGYYSMVSCVLNAFEVKTPPDQPVLPSRDSAT